jgi:Family of unknown function (DUF6011)
MTSTDRQPARCLRCGHTLRAAASVTAGYGPVCARRIRDAAKAVPGDFTAKQREQAAQLIADGGIIPASRPGTYQAVSSDGSTVYVAGADFCGCRAGQNGIRCYRRIAAMAQHFDQEGRLIMTTPARTMADLRAELEAAGIRTVTPVVLDEHDEYFYRLEQQD